MPSGLMELACLSRASPTVAPVDPSAFQWSAMPSSTHETPTLWSQQSQLSGLPSPPLLKLCLPCSGPAPTPILTCSVTAVEARSHFPHLIGHFSPVQVVVASTLGATSATRLLATQTLIGKSLSLLMLAGPQNHAMFGPLSLNPSKLFPTKGKLTRGLPGPTFGTPKSTPMPSLRFVDAAKQSTLGTLVFAPTRW